MDPKGRFLKVCLKESYDNPFFEGVGVLKYKLISTSPLAADRKANLPFCIIAGEMVELTAVLVSFVFGSDSQELSYSDLQVSVGAVLPSFTRSQLTPNRVKKKSPV
mmetsp:Transcript_38806/g.89765  ORF Transcript_38806/g.89765 Transcript_38806/m.89765 type:complete len:106 (+) Transcript_38806:56-373(+)